MFQAQDSREFSKIACSRLGVVSRHIAPQASQPCGKSRADSLVPDREGFYIEDSDKGDEVDFPPFVSRSHASAQYGARSARSPLSRISGPAASAASVAGPIAGKSTDATSTAPLHWIFASGLKADSRDSNHPSSTSGPEPPSAEPVALVIGAGDAIGSAVARRFAREGYVAVVVRRNGSKLQVLVDGIAADGGKAVGFGVDARREDQVAQLVATVEAEIGPIHVMVFNIGANVKFNVVDTNSRVYFKVWEMACLAGFLASREAAQRMLVRNSGTIIFTGATASVRGAAGFSAFSGAKHALRALAQCLAKELGPQGIHVSHVVIDGAVDTPWIRESFPDMVWEKDKVDGLVQPDDVADLYWSLHMQKRSGWTFEVDLRPWKEKW
ncbi:hypothetical protein CLOM_g9650 [Closterium sp. NIES-68]|nr:hypothetical protein CLOM_g6077 [Closterium sp. NIES-68]GJP50485.1 hypothetical protein CLOM_g9650 [Closterium sp. NIES-68]GJP58492.1 hypothetical protein CLOP_g352 [Closterium sp. NIES-67]GJP79280.1 hypothetical protein CLOP_g9531 [Closterium sp. NIES-67]